MFNIDEDELEKSLNMNPLNRTLGGASKFRSIQAAGIVGKRQIGT
jgi:hypothetical protein